jgi:hypothetical protein
MSPSPEHEALHRVFQYDEKLFARSLANILGKPVPEPVDVSVLTVDLTETRPIERRADTILLAQSRRRARTCRLPCSPRLRTAAAGRRVPY